MSADNKYFILLQKQITKHTPCVCSELDSSFCEFTLFQSRARKPERHVGNWVRSCRRKPKLLSFSTNRVLQAASLRPYVEGLVGPVRPSPGLGSIKEPPQKQAKSNDVWQSLSLDLSGYAQRSITNLHRENSNTFTDSVPCEFHLPIPKMHLSCVLWSF